MIVNTIIRITQYEVVCVCVYIYINNELVNYKVIIFLLARIGIKF